MNAIKGTVFVGAIAFSLPFGGCANNPQVLEAPYDELTFEKATPEPEMPKPVEIVEVPKPLPLPGQLKAVPSKGTKGEKVAPQRAIASANQAARIEPTRNGYVNAMQI
jgi:type IV secretion system protein TrbG